MNNCISQTFPKFYLAILSISSIKLVTVLPAMSTPSIAVPGQDLGPVSKNIPGPGTHIHNSHLFASILGFIHIQHPPKPAGPQKRLTKITLAAPMPLPTISVTRLPFEEAPVSNPKSLPNEQTKGESQDKAELQTQRKGKAEVLPEVNSIVLCKVTRITPRQATVAILVVGETVLNGEWQGLIRVQDVRATEKDRVKIFESFRPGDIVRAIVVSSLSISSRCAISGPNPFRTCRMFEANNFVRRYLWGINQITTFLPPVII